MIFSPSSVDSVTLFDSRFLIKRDDSLHPWYSGNKIRKLYSLFQDEQIHHLVSYGGYQSNAMLSMAFFAHEKGIRFTYITKPLPDWVGEMTEGNYHHAIRLGMKHLQVFHTDYHETITRLGATYPDALVIDQGAAHPAAEAGIKMLAEELAEYIFQERIGNPGVLLPSGTGTTALYLAKHLPESIPVYTTPCVGDAAYLKAQWHTLEPALPRYPLILATQKKHHFAKPYPELLEISRRLNASGIEFDMIYAPKTWLSYLENREMLADKSLIYIHTGGVPGNPTQRERYRHKGMLPS